MERVKELDGLRAIAILLVVIWHYVGIPDGPNFILWKMFSAGRFGVDLFFVLSGYLITTILLKNREMPSFFSTFYGRRIFRIFPIYCLMFAIYFVGSRAGWSPALFDGPVPWWTYAVGVQNIWMTRLHTDGAFWLGGTWSLAIEEQFYLLFPLVVRWIKPENLPKVLLIILVACPLGRLASAFAGDLYGYYFLTPLRADTLAIGALIAWRGQFGGRNWNLVAKIVLAAATLCLPLLFYFGSDSFHSAAWEHTLITLFFGSGFFLVLQYKGSPSLWWLRSEVAAFFASISYAFYMSQHWVLYLVFAAIPVRHTLTTVSGVSLTALAFVLTTILCWISRNTFEKFFNGFAHKRFRYGAQRAAVVPAPAE